MAAPTTTYKFFIDDEFISEHSSGAIIPLRTPSPEAGKTFIGFVDADGVNIVGDITITADTYLYTKWSYNTVVVDGQYLADIADAIRSKNGKKTKYTPPQMASAISDFSAGGDIQVATGTFEGGSSVVTVSDLPFCPTYVEIMAMYDESTYSVSSGASNHLISARYGTLNGKTFNEYVFYRVAAKSFTGTANTMFAAGCSFNDTGFDFSAIGNMSGTFLPVTYSYIAIG